MYNKIINTIIAAGQNEQQHVILSFGKNLKYSWLSLRLAALNSN